MSDNEEKFVVSFYMSKEAKENLDKMAELLTHTKQGRSVTLDVIISYCDEHFENIKSWHEKQIKEHE
jgi:hypothetical protein